jgi:transposase
MRAEILGQERRRRRTGQQKVEIVRFIGVNGATLADVVRRHGVTRQQIYTWRHDLKKRGLLLAAAEPAFLSVGMPTV